MSRVTVDMWGPQWDEGPFISHNEDKRDALNLPSTL